ncbi:hypothetical protein [Arcobacter sp. FWKO B]|uniref:hypothetical protein n=1 Tax=Arcobacter sp. FWKO B TaxID=2593672 RepID=UPI0018A53235|nr:hypothetical protein [Arcobacter sp. FWKO B]QOG12765.1 hypothetical protein FWKOB_08695 [Arcobacter sp. FWKO B]
MLLNRRVVGIIVIIFGLVLLVGFYQINTFVKNEKLKNDAYYALGQLEVYNKKLLSYFDGKIKIENYDLIEDDFIEAYKLSSTLDKSLLNKDLYSEHIKKFEILNSKKDRYKALSSQIVMSLFLIQKMAFESNDNKKIKIYYTFLEYAIERKNNTDLIGSLIEDLKDDIFKSHCKLIVDNLKELFKITTELSR